MSQTGGWRHSWDKHLGFSCPAGSALTRLVSKHHNHYEDRLWALQCEQLPGPISNACSWTGGPIITLSHLFPGYVNNWDARLDYTCPGNGFLSGRVEPFDWKKHLLNFLCLPAIFSGFQVWAATTEMTKKIVVSSSDVANRLLQEATVTRRGTSTPWTPTWTSPCQLTTSSMVSTLTTGGMYLLLSNQGPSYSLLFFLLMTLFT